MKLKVIIILSALLVFGCDNTGGYTIEDPVEISGLSSRISLNSIPAYRSYSSAVVDGYNSLEEIANDLDRIALEEGLKYIEEYNQYLYTLEDGIAMDGAAEKSSENGITDGYQTNNQVSGIDEADSVKSDGELIYRLVGGSIVVFNLAGEILDSVTLTSEVNRSIAVDDCSIPWYCYPAELLIYEDKIITYISGYSDKSVIYIITHNSGDITSTESYEVDGYINNVRLDGSNLIYSSTTGLDMWEITNGLFDYDIDLIKDLFVDEKAQARARLEKAIPNWRNKVLLKLFGRGEDVDLDLIRNTLKIYNPEKNSGDESEKSHNYNSYSMVTTWDIDTGFETRKSGGAFTAGYESAFYSNGAITVIASSGWEWVGDWEWEETTYLHAFYTDSDVTKPLATGEFDGRLLNQFSLDYYQDHLRAAFTIGRWVNPDNYLLVLGINGSDLEITGRIDDIGKPGETIRSVRFMGDRAYIVTFETTDPLYSLDLSDPDNPEIAGELEIDGFSSYLHPVDENTLIGIGSSADGNGWITGFKIDLYDVSDINNPQRPYSVEVKGAWSDTTWDHHAFRYVPSIKTLVVPLSNWDNYNYEESFSLYKIDGGITKIGEIVHEMDNYPSYYSGYQGPRAMVFTHNGDDVVITMKNGYAKSSRLEDLSQVWFENLLEK